MLRQKGARLSGVLAGDDKAVFPLPRSDARLPQPGAQDG